MPLAAMAGLKPDGSVGGAGGEATAGGLILTALNRVGNSAMRGTLHAGAVAMSATAIGGTGSANGAGYAGGRNLFDVTNSDVTMASFVMFNAGSSGGDPGAQLDPFIIRNGSVSVTGDFAVLNPTTVSLWSDGGNLSAGSFSVSAGNFIRDFTSPASVTPGTISAGTITLSSGQDIVVDANLSSGSALTLGAPGFVTVRNLTTTGTAAGSDVTVGAGTNVITGAINASRAVSVSAGSTLTTGAITSQTGIGLTAGTNVITGAITAGGGVNILAGGTLTAGALDALNDINLNAVGSILTGAISSQAGAVRATSGGNITTGNIAADGGLSLDAVGAIATGTIAAQWADLFAGANMSVGDATTTEWFDAEAEGALTAGHVTAGENVALAGQGAVRAGNLSAGLVNNAVRAGADYNIGILSGTSVVVGNASARDWIGIGTPGSLATGSIASGNDVLLAANGAVTTGAIATGTSSRLLIAGAGMVALGGPVDDFDRSLVFAALGTSAEAATLGAVTIGGPVTTGRLDALVGGDFTTGALTASGAAFATVGGTMAINGLWASPLTRIESNNLAIGANGGIGGAQIDLLSSNATQLLVGDGLSGSGYGLDNGEFGRLSAGIINIFGRSDASAAIDTLVGTLGLAGRTGPSSVTIATANSDGQPAGNLRVIGAVTGTDFGATDSFNLAAGRIEVDAATGGISLDVAGGVGGMLGLRAQRVHVAEAAILDRLAIDPHYATRDADLARAPSTQRPAGVIRAGEIKVELVDAAATTGTAPYSVLVQNVGTSQTPAGFLRDCRRNRVAGRCAAGVDRPQRQRPVGHIDRDADRSSGARCVDGR